MISKIIPEEKVLKAKELIEHAQRIAIVGHTAPDGDAIGAALGLYHFFFSINKEALVIFPDAHPRFFDWMHGIKEVLLYDRNTSKVEEALQQVDLIICVDFNEIKRVGELAPLLEASPVKKILLDHHPNPTEFCNITISQPQIVSTSEIVFRLICRMGHYVDINKFCAESIYTGMMTDTGGFAFNSNQAEIYFIIGELLHKGIDKDDIYNKVYNTNSADRMRLMGYMLSEKMRIYPEYKTALITLSLEEQRRFNYQKGDSEGFVNIPLSIEGIVFLGFYTGRC
jgi:bifunctional oligoribonuclease and PAP phosphatase NrnA